MTVIEVTEARERFEELLRRAQAGEDIVIAEEGRSVVRLTPLTPRRGPRVPGDAAGQIRISSDFDDPLPEAWLREFYEGDLSPSE